MKTLCPLLIAALCSTAVSADVKWIDVRTAREHAEDRIPGDPLIPHNNIVSGVSALFPDKDTDIRLYCRSGRRSGIAKSELEQAGYTEVTNVGGIDDARERRGLDDTD